MAAADPSYFEIAVRRGDDLTLAVTWDPLQTTVDLTGATAEMVIAWPSAEVPVIAAGSIEFSTTAGDIVIAGKVISVNMESTETVEIPFGAAAAYQLRVTTASGNKTTIAQGPVTVIRSFLDA